MCSSDLVHVGQNLMQIPRQSGSELSANQHLLFMVLKAGFIIAIFMHMAWERKALIWAILGPPVVLLVLIGLMVVEGDYTELTRLRSFSAPVVPAGHVATEEAHH